MVDPSMKAANWQMLELIYSGLLCAECTKEIDGKESGDPRLCSKCSGEDFGDIYSEDVLDEDVDVRNIN